MKRGQGVQRRWLTLTGVTLSLIALGILDYATGWELSLVMLYAVPVFYTAWYVDRPHALIIATGAAMTWWCANLWYHPYHTTFGFASAIVTRFGYFIFVALGGVALRAQRDADRERIAVLERTRLLEAEIVRASECEQQRIGRDLHDGLCQCLAGIKLAAKALADDLAKQGAAAAHGAREIESLLSEGIIHARSVARGLVPVHMGELGLCLALEELAATTQRLTRMLVEFQSAGNVSISDAEISTQLYRIAQEALSNALKHGESRLITIRLAEERGILMLSVADQGRGFSDSGIRHAGIGLASMRCRAHSIGAELRIEPRHGGGTVVTCTLSAHRAHSPSQGQMAEAL